jgi:hypothetical protein
MNDTELDIALRVLAKTQHQVVSRAQARRLGATREEIASKLASPDWESATPRVLRLLGSSESFEQDCMIATLDASGVVPGETALALFGVPGFGRKGPIRGVRLRGGTRRPSSVAIVSEVKLLPEHHCLRINGIPSVTPTRALFDIAARLHMQKVQRSLNSAWRMGLTNGRAVHKMGVEWPKRGRTGSAAMRMLLDATPLDYVPTASNLEDRFLSVLADGDFPTPTKQVDLGNDAAWIGRVDFHDPDFPLIAEINSDAFHTAPFDVEADKARYRALTEAGFHVEPFTEHEIWHEPAVVRRRWREARANLRAKRGNHSRALHAGSDVGAG